MWTLSKYTVAPAHKLHSVSHRADEAEHVGRIQGLTLVLTVSAVLIQQTVYKLIVACVTALINVH